MAALPSDGRLTIQAVRDGETIEVSLNVQPSCRSLVEILPGDGPRARSDGRVVQIRQDFAAGLSDDQLAVVFAHELAHTVLLHRARKEAVGIDNNLLAEVGRNQQVNRQAEVEADRLSVHLLANAGYDPALASAFWRSEQGREAGGGLMPSFVYPSQSARADLIDAEIARYLWQRRGPSWPGHLLALRDRPW